MVDPELVGVRSPRGGERRARTLIVIALAGLGSLGAAEAPNDGPSISARLSSLVARPNGLMADDVAKLATTTSFALEQRKAEVSAAIAATNQAIVAFLPRLSLLARYARLSSIVPPVLGNVVVTDPGAPLGPLGAGAALYNASVVFPVVLNQTTLQATLSIPLTDYLLRLPAMNRSARSSLEVARLTERAVRLQVATDARVAYYAWARARLSVAVADLALSQARGHRDATRRLFESGSTSKADTMRVEAQLSSAELFLERARNLETVLDEQLRIAMHEPRRLHHEIGENLNDDLPLAEPEQLRNIISEAQQNRLEVAALKSAAEALRAEASADRGAAIPRIDAVGDLLDASPNPRYFPYHPVFHLTWDVGVQLTFSPNDTANHAFAAKGADARARSMDAQVGALEDALRLEAVQTYEAVREADFAVESTGRGLAAAEESYRVRRELFQHGRSTSYELTDAETDLTQARLAAIGARIDQRIARTRFSHALGRDVNGTASR